MVDTIDGKVIQCVFIGKVPLSEREIVTIDLEQLVNGKCPDLVKAGKGGYALFYHVPETKNGQAIAVPAKAIKIPKGSTKATYSGYRTKLEYPFYENIEWEFE